LSAESPRITELRRRVESDPSSIAFAQLAEEYRRAGNYEAAERYCRTGLARHPLYLSARVTLGRTLIELNKLDEAEHELQQVLSAAPDNLAALRGVADIHQRLNNPGSALEYYRRALALSRHDPELEEIVDRLERSVAPAPPPAPDADALMDFDALLDSLGIQDRAAPPSVEALLNPATSDPQPAVSSDPAADRISVEEPTTASAETSPGPEPEWAIGPLPDIKPPISTGAPVEGASPAEAAAELVPAAAAINDTIAPGVIDPAALDAAANAGAVLSAAAPDAGDGGQALDAVDHSDAPLEFDRKGDELILEELEAWLAAVRGGTN
jgi:tetratricopeptide (TPR) repeat protein